MEAFKDLVVPSIKIYAVGGQETLNIGVFNGRVSFTIWPGKESGQKGKIWGEDFSPDYLVKFKEYITKIRTAAPETKFPVKFMNYDTETKAYNVKSVFIVGKDERQVAYLEVQFKNDAGSKTCLRFNLLCPKGLVFGTEEITDDMRSEVKVQVLLDWLSGEAVIGKVLSGRKPNYGGGGGGNWKNKNSGGGGGGQAKQSDSFGDMF